MLRLKDNQIDCGKSIVVFYSPCLLQDFAVLVSSGLQCQPNTIMLTRCEQIANRILCIYNRGRVILWSVDCADVIVVSLFNSVMV